MLGSRVCGRGDRAGRADRLGKSRREPGLGRAPGAASRARAKALRSACARGARARALLHRARHGASSTNPTAGPAPQAGAGAPGSTPGEALAPALPGVPAVGAGGPGEGSPGGAVKEAAPASIPHVQVVAVEYHYTLSRTTVPAGKVVLQFVNNGQDEHNLNVLAGEGELEAAFPKTVSHGVRETTMKSAKAASRSSAPCPNTSRKGCTRR